MGAGAACWKFVLSAVRQRFKRDEAEFILLETGLNAKFCLLVS
jgi:hypothetical protein